VDRVRGCHRHRVLRDRGHRPLSPAAVTAAAGVGVDRQYAVFGAFGAITVMALSGVLLDRLRAAAPAAPSPQHGPPTATA
jgi:hypothetical protein